MQSVVVSSGAVVRAQCLSSVPAQRGGEIVQSMVVSSVAVVRAQCLSSVPAQGGGEVVQSVVVSSGACFYQLLLR